MSNGTAEKGWTTERLKSVAEFVGVTAGGGAGFAALAFGIGFLATKHHSAMLGVPTTTTDQTTYVRTGALFFSQTLHDLVAFVASFAQWLLMAVAILLLLGLLVYRFRSWLSRKVMIQRSSVAALLATLVFTASLVALPYHLAALDAGNKNLLFERRSVGGAAAHVNTALRSKDGEAELHRLYGWQWTRLLLLGLGLLGVYRLRGAAPTSGATTQGNFSLEALANRVMPPVTGGLLGAMLATTPANYGVLAMSTSLPCVQLWQTTEEKVVKELGDPGFLLSDLSSEEAAVAVLRWDTERLSYFVDFHKREVLHQVEVRACSVRNPINRVIGRAPQAVN